jgi:hypothetical protein
MTTRWSRPLGIFAFASFCVVLTCMLARWRLPNLWGLYSPIDGIEQLVAEKIRSPCFIAVKLPTGGVARWRSSSRCKGLSDGSGT